MGKVRAGVQRKTVVFSRSVAYKYIAPLKFSMQKHQWRVSFSHAPSPRFERGTGEEIPSEVGRGVRGVISLDSQSVETKWYERELEILVQTPPLGHEVLNVPQGVQQAMCRYYMSWMPI